MNSGTKTVIAFLLMFFSAPLWGQDESITHYSIENGLQSNLVKAVYMDAQGYIWTGGDAGLAKFDGYKFRNQNINIPGIYVKGLVKRNENAFLVLSDAGITEVTGENGKYKFRDIQSDGGFDYPKSGFCDSRGRVWIAGSASISLITDNSVHKYIFPDNFKTVSYFRSFQVFEGSKGEIYAVSYRGILLHYSEKENRFLTVKELLENRNDHVDAILRQEESNNIFGNRVLIGTNTGIFELEVIDNKVIFEKVLDLPDVSALAFNEGKLYAGTYEAGVFEIAPEPGTKRMKNPDVKQFGNFDQLGEGGFSVKSIIIGNDRSIWIGTDNGLFLLKRYTFSKIDLKKNFNYPGKNFIIQIKAVDDIVWFSDTHYIFSADYSSGKNVLSGFQIDGGELIHSFSVQPGIMWVSLLNNELRKINLKNKSTLFKKMFPNDRVNTSCLDRSGNFFGYLEATRRLLMIDSQMKEYYFDFPGPRDVKIFNMVEDGEGNIWLGGSSENGSLFRFVKDKGLIERIDLKGSEMNEKSLVIYDFIINSGVIHLATNQGLYRVNDRKTIEKINLPDEFEGIPLKGIHFDRSGNLWLGSDAGLIYYYDNKCTFFTKEDGLPNSTIVPNGISESANGFLVAATAGGIAELDLNKNLLRTIPSPIITNFSTSDELENGNLKQKFSTGERIFVNSHLLHYPNEKLFYQYRIMGYDSIWSKNIAAVKLEFFFLPAGDYIFEVRGLHHGHLISEKTAYPFMVITPWYRTAVAWVVYGILFIALIVFGSIRIMNSRIRNLQDISRKLELIVKERTAKLKEETEKTEELLEKTESARAELQKANEIKNHFLAVASHDLKNPLSNVIGLTQLLYDTETDDERKELLELMNESSSKMLELIRALLEEAAMNSGETKMKLVSHNISLIAKETGENYMLRAEAKHQKIIFDIQDNVFADIDKFWMESAVDNLLSNAVKYSPLGGEIRISVRSADGYAIISVKDSGPGLTDDDKKKVFGQFQKLSAKPTGGESSSGLGLSIVKEIILKHNGEILVDSTQGEGSEFIIKLKTM